MIIGLLGLQGAFQDHIPHLQGLSLSYEIIRGPQGLAHIDRLILPGGESTVMTQFLNELGMTDPLKKRIAAGMPVWGICAGAILLSRQVDDHPGILAALPVKMIRNACGRQSASDFKTIEIPLLGLKNYRAGFIRAPKIILMDDRVRVHATAGLDPVFIQCDHVMATTFHPEIGTDASFHRYFLQMKSKS